VTLIDQTPVTGSSATFAGNADGGQRERLQAGTRFAAIAVVQTWPPNAHYRHKAVMARHDVAQCW
jgi:hypothetical protein